MGLGVDVRVDAQADRQGTTELLCDAFDDIELLDVFDVQRPNAGVCSCHDFFAPLADSAVHDVLGREACLERALHLSCRDDVRTAALGGEARKHGQIAVGFDGIRDQVRRKGERFVDRAIGVVDRSARVDERRCVDLVGDRFQRHVFADERPVSIREPRRFRNVNVGHGSPL